MSNSTEPHLKAVIFDMDGVLADFFSEFAKLAGVQSGNYREIPSSLKDPTLDKMIGTDFYARLPKFPSADELIRMTIDTFGSYSICSSPLRGDNENSAHWKRVWIKKHLNPQPETMIFTGRKYKSAVQKNGTPNILVDDRGKVLQEWREAGGIGIKYQADEDSLDVVRKGYAEALTQYETE